MNIEPEQRLSAARRLSIALLAVVGVWAGGTAPASAEGSLPGWELTAHTFPTYLAPGKQGTIEIRILNVGAAPSTGTVTVTDVLPPGVTATKAGAVVGERESEPSGLQPELEPEVWDCSGNGPGGAVADATVVTCVNDPVRLPHLAAGNGTPTKTRVNPTEASDPILAIGVTAPASEGTISEPNRVTVAGGGALNTASTHVPVTVSSTPAPFGFADADAWFSNANGTIDTQAGSHPYEATFLFDMNNHAVVEGFPLVQVAGGESRNLTFDLPPGFVGAPTVMPTCSRKLFNANKCPSDSQIGVVSVEALGDTIFQTSVLNSASPVFNLVPPAGEPAQFGFEVFGVPTLIDTGVRSGGDYAIVSKVNNIAQRVVVSSVLTLWSEPGDPSHNQWRIGSAVNGGEKPFLTLPTSCEGPQEYSLSVNEWENPGVVAHTSFVSHDANHEQLGFTGCEELGFGPTITIAPDTSNADTPAGLTVEVKPQLGGLLVPEGLSSSNLKDTTVALPEGLAINPGQAAGLEACGPAEDGLTSESEKAKGEENTGPPSCPNASKVGADEVQTPLVAKPLRGDVYIMRSNPPELKLLVAASGEGVNLKVVGTVHLNEQTGQLVTTFENTPELPFTLFRLSFSGGPQAALSTPTLCGTYGAAQGFSADFTPWASPFVANATPDGAQFGITAGTTGAPCPSSPLPFSPNMIAGSTTDQAGGYTSFSLLLQRPDDQQRVSTLQFKTPEGLLGMISKVPLCPEPEASQGTCPAASQIGHTVVAAGPGPYPLVVPQPGQPPAPIYLTGGYRGAPYGLSIVVPLVVGPFTLQTQVVRGKIEVDRHTARLTVTTDPLPTIIAGVPADLRTINAVIDRPGFMFNPTNCSPQAFTGTATSSQGATAPLESHFQMGSCRALLFKPNFKVATSGKTSRKNGASLNVKLLYPNVPPGNNQASLQSNIQSVKVDLPKQLPSRLTTLQKACSVSTFEANPAACPKESIVGHAIARTPVMPVPLTGPAYFVSHAGEEFPQLIVVLQGYGVTIDLVGDTFINSKTNVTSSTFKQIPDVPITSFELTLPQGPFSALAANANLCRSKLAMPTAFTAQDGAVIHQSTPINVTGCAKTKKTKGKAKKKK